MHTRGDIILHNISGLRCPISGEWDDGLIQYVVSSTTNASIDWMSLLVRFKTIGTKKSSNIYFIAIFYRWVCNTNIKCREHSIKVYIQTRVTVIGFTMSCVTLPSPVFLFTIDMQNATKTAVIYLKTEAAGSQCIVKLWWLQWLHLSPSTVQLCSWEFHAHAPIQPSNKLLWHINPEKNEHSKK